MKEKLFWIIVIVMMVFVSVLPKEKPMAIDLERGSYPQYIDFGDYAALKTLTDKTICVWHKPESLNNYQHIFDINVIKATGLSGYMTVIHNGVFRFITNFTGGQAAWGAGSVSAGAESFFCVSYNNSSTTNDPVMYINGAPSAVTEILTPSGTIVDSGGTTTIGFGITGQVDTQYDGIVRKVLVYNRILTASEIKDMYDSKGASYPRNGLVFCPVLHGAKGLQAFDGTTLAATNLIVDSCSGATGVPSGNPIAVGETYLSIK